MTDRIKAPLAQEDGAILVLSAFLLIVLLALAAFAVDLTMQSSDRQQLWNSSDAAALAGAALLPDGVAAEAQAADTALANDDALVDGNLETTFRCLVAANSAGNAPRVDEVPNVCNPAVGIAGDSLAVPPIPAGWTCANGVCTAFCIPAFGDTCNTIVLATQATTDYAFGPVIGVDSGDTQILSAACRGTCGSGLTGPVDLVLVIDRSGSMTPGDMDKVEKASLAMLNFFDPAVQQVGLAVLPPAQKLNECAAENPGSPTQWSNGRWLIVGLSDDYKDTPNLDVNGDLVNDLDSTSELVNRIICSTDAGWTDLGSPIRDASNTTSELGDDAMWELFNGALARPDVRKGILLLSDGGANQPATEANPCRFARDQAIYARNQGVEVFTIGFGVDSRSQTCEEDEAAPYGTTLFPPDGAPVTRLLADMASQPSFDNCTAATTDLENTDDDHFFCVPKDEDLSRVFLAIAAELAQGSRLVQLPPGA